MYRYRFRTKITKVSGTGVDVMTDLPKCPVPLWMLYRRHRSARYRCESMYRYRRHRYCSRTEVTEVSGTGIDVVPVILAVCLGTVSKKRYQAVGFPCCRMLKLRSSREIRIDVPVLSVSWSFEDYSVIIQALRRTYRARGQRYWRSPSLEVLLSRSSGRGYNI